MLKSMTGFGKTDFKTGNKNIQVEIRSLNSKSLDISLKIPTLYREKESDIRNIISNLLQRGKVDFGIFIEIEDLTESAAINNEVVKAYYTRFVSLASEIGITTPEPMQLFILALRMPDSTKTSGEKLNETEWNTILKGINEAIDKVNAFRVQEGKILEEDLKIRIKLILDLLQKVDPFEKSRIVKYKERIHKQLTENLQSNDYDKNRFEQELIYYIEKLDITEEKVRLKNHCDYFIEMMYVNDSSGKKLGFIAQEIGREINTLGSKANDFEIQKLVVQMKDELEKIKEQLMNIL